MSRSIEELRRIAGIKLAELAPVKETMKVSARPTFRIIMHERKERFGPQVASTRW